MLPVFQPLILARRPQPFSHPDWIFEVKYDGFRALAHIESGRAARLVSRNGNEFAGFPELCEGIARLNVNNAVLDGEIVCLDHKGHSQFNELLFHRGIPRFCAFDLLWLNGRDLRSLPLVERKRALRSLVPKRCLEILYVDHYDGDGERLFELTCKHDLEGIVASVASRPARQTAHK